MGEGHHRSHAYFNLGGHLPIKYMEVENLPDLNSYNYDPYAEIKDLDTYSDLKELLIRACSAKYRCLRTGEYYDSESLELALYASQ